MRTTTDKLFLVAEGQVRDFDGDLEDYQRWLLDFRKQGMTSIASEERSTMSRKEQRQQNAKTRDEKRPLLQKIQRMEEAMAKHQKEALVIETRLADTTLYEEHNKEKLQSELQAQAALNKQIAHLEKEWLAACEERDKN